MIVSVGAPNAHLAAYEQELVRKMRRICAVSFVELAASRARTPHARRREEAKRILRAAVHPYALLDPEGAPLDEEMLASWMRTKPACFVIGGPDGVDEHVRRQAARCWRLGALVHSHALARAILVEQLFRVAMAAIGHPYPR